MIQFLTALHTDVGIIKETNQDSLCIKSAKTDIGNILLAVVCDGMGGLKKGELASATVIRRFSYWFDNELPLIIHDITMDRIRNSFSAMIDELNNRIIEYGENNGISLGTTLTAIFFTEEEYIVAHVGDSRAYIIEEDTIRMITEDQTGVGREVRRGLLTEEQAKTDPRRNILLQCIGATRHVEPDYTTGTLTGEVLYMVWSDGFRHTIRPEELHRELKPGVCNDEDIMRQKAIELVELNKARKERDNISVILIRPVVEDK